MNIDAIVEKVEKDITLSHEETLYVEELESKVWDRVNALIGLAGAINDLIGAPKVDEYLFGAEYK